MTATLRQASPRSGGLRIVTVALAQAKTVLVWVPADVRVGGIRVVTSRRGLDATIPVAIAETTHTRLEGRRDGAALHAHTGITIASLRLCP